MKEERSVFELANDPQFIPGIYNYCDRWCERCRLSHRCMVYAMEKDELDQLSTLELADETYWKKLISALDKIMAKLRSDFEQAGIDFDEDACRMLTQAARERNKAHPLSREAQRYAKQVKAWMSKAKHHFGAKIDELYQRLQLGLDEASIADDSDQIVEAIDVIVWYQHEIHIKTLRALAQSAIEQQTSDGAAKVALLCIDDSIRAWNTLRQQLPDKSDELLTFLASLSRLKKEIERRFPHARGFKRPGFDD